MALIVIKPEFLKHCRESQLENLCYTLQMRIIRSSDIGNYLYCRRSWWYRKNGTPSENQAELSAGTALHKKHGRQVLASLLTRTVGLILFLAAVLLLVAYCTAQVV
jgi:CRISPR/Cas system-associated exonuclease Cas4 (RecB family)